MKKILIFLLLVSTGFAQEPVNFGWSPPTPEQKALSQDNQFTQQLRDLVQYNDDSDALIYRFLYKALKDSNQLTQEELDSGRLNSLNQFSYGHCCGFGAARALSVTAACDVYVRHENEQFKVQINPTAAYALSRQEHLGRFDGSTGYNVVNSMNKYGSLHYLLYDSFDLRQANGDDGRRWAANGIPKELLEAATAHKVIACAKIKTTAEAQAAISNGYGIIICAQASYASKRGQFGEAKLIGDDWAHAQSVVAYRSKNSGFEGFLICNSWGNDWQSGPIWLDQPFGSYWISPKELEYSLKQDDTYALAGYNGFKKRNLKWEELFKIGEKINVEDN